MKKHVFGRKLQRDTNERKALFKSLMSALIINEGIKTTEAKAKAVKSEVEKLVTKAKNGGKEAERVLQGYFSTPVLKKLINDVAPRFSNRPGGYTRIIKLGNRLRDNAKMVMFEWVDKKPEVVQAEVLNEDTPSSGKNASNSQKQLESSLSVKEKDDKVVKSKGKKESKQANKSGKKVSKKETKKS